MKTKGQFVIFSLDYAVLAFFYWLFSGSIAGSLLLPLICCVALFSFRNYDREHLSDFNEQLVRSFVSLVSANIVSYIILRIIYISFFEGVGRIRLTDLAFHTIVSVPSIALVNFFFYKLIKKRIAPEKFAVLGEKSELEELLKEIERKSEEYAFVTYIKEKEQLKNLPKDLSGIVVADYSLFESLKQDLSTLNHKKIIFLPHIAESVLKRVPLKLIEKFSAYYEVCFNKVQEQLWKRLIDIIFSSILLVLASPIMLFIALAVYFEDGRPIIYRQKRIGKNGEEFEFIKFRSLKQEGFDPKDPNRNIEQRMLKIGRFIRNHRLDELPQLWLVLKGTMSLVGPRPEMVEYHSKYSQQIPYYDYRLKVKPGLTGWAQINYKHTTTLEEYRTKTEYELYYIKKCSALFDLNIILKTLEAVIYKRGVR